MARALLEGRAQVSSPGEAALLLREILGWSRAQLIARDHVLLATDQVAAYRRALARRAAGEPVAYIVGHREFFGRVFRVTPAVLIPRPETELLVELGLDQLFHRGAGDAPHVLDLGTGSGVLAITLALECPAARVMAVDRSAAALGVAAENACQLGAEVAFKEADWFSGLPGGFDLIVANPPYIVPGDEHLRLGDLRFEPESALVAAEHGMADLRRIISAAPAHLAAGGTVLVEHGYDQAAAVRDLLQQHGFAEVASWRDLAGIERVSGGRLR